MSGKVIDVCAGDRWTKDRYGDIWQKRDNLVRWVLRDIHNKDAVSRWATDDGSVNGTLLPTPEAHAQLREWGYEICGEPQQHTTGFITTSPVIDGATWTLPPNTAPTKTLGERVAALEMMHAALFSDIQELHQDRDESQLIPDSRVREIVEEVLAAKQNLYSQIREWGKVEVKTDPRAANHAPAPDDWRGLLAELVKAVDDADGNSGFSAASAWHKVWASPALSSARTKLAAKGGK